VRRAPGPTALSILFASLALALTPLVAPASAASDWEEDDPYARAPRPAPPYQRSQRPQTRRNIEEATERVIDNPDAASDGRRTAFTDPTEAGGEAIRHGGGGGKPRLEGGVSKYGLGADTRPPMSAGAAQDVFRLPVLIPRRATSVPPSTFRLWLEKSHPQFALSTTTMSREHVLEVRGKWDDSARTVRALGIPHTVIRPGRLPDHPLDQVQIMVINCAGDVPYQSLQQIRDFVARGGFLISTDWTLDGVIRRAFPGYVEWNGGKTDVGVVDGTVVAQDPDLTRSLPRRASWKLDDGSQTVRVINKQRVHVLVQSAMLARSGDDPDALGILAFWFAFGRGAVLHLVGHFDNNTNLAHLNMLQDPAPGIGISLRQALATNFLVSALKERQKRATAH